MRLCRGRRRGDLLSGRDKKKKKKEGRVNEALGYGKGEVEGCREGVELSVVS